MARLSDWFKQHPPSMWLRLLEAGVKALNWLLLLCGAGCAVWAGVTVAQVRRALHGDDGGGGDGPAAVAAALLLSGAAAAGALPLRRVVPWPISACGGLGAAASAVSLVALLGARLRSLPALSSHVFLMCLLATAQACACVGGLIDTRWDARLPHDTPPELLSLLGSRLRVARALNVGLFALQLLALLLSCGLQGAYVGAEEAAEDADDEEAWRRRPLLAAQRRREEERAIGRAVFASSSGGASGGGGGGISRSPAGAGRIGGGGGMLPSSSSATAAAAASSSPAEDREWRQHMRQEYGLDVSGFGHQQPSQQGQQQQEGVAGDGDRASRCAIM